MILVAECVALVALLAFVVGDYTDQAAGPTAVSGWSTTEEAFQISTEDRRYDVARDR